MTRTKARIANPTILALLAITPIQAGQNTSADLARQFPQTVQPFLSRYCAGCHSGKSAAAALDLKAYPTVAAVVQDFSRWSQIAAKLTAGQMPPQSAPQPPGETARAVIDWIRAVRADEIRENANDPGVVLARRLSNAEYNNTIRDLTGVDIRPAREFPVDPANTAGFDNSGESLSMSPALLDKYLQAARSVGNHMALTADGFLFAPHPMLVETDRDRYCIQRILDFYKSQPTDLADYFQAAWRHRHRRSLGKPGATLAEFAKESNVSRLLKK